MEEGEKGRREGQTDTRRDIRNVGKRDKERAEG